MMAEEDKEDDIESCDFLVCNAVSSEQWSENHFKSELSCIFSEVEKNLPSIDFDLSDVSSDEGDGTIFQRIIKTPTLDDDKLQMESVFGDDLVHEASHDDKDSVYNTADMVKPVDPSDIILSTEQSLNAHNKTSVGVATDTNTGLSSTGPSSTGPSSTGSSSTGSSSTGPSSTSTGTMCSESDLEMCDDDSNMMVQTDHMHDAHETPVKTQINDCDMSRTNTKNKNSVKTLPSANCEKIVLRFISHEAPKLTFDNFNLNRLHYDDHGGSGEPNHILPSPESADFEDNESLIEKLARLSHTQSGLELRDIDPDTGAIHQRQPTPKEVKTQQNLSVIVQTSTTTTTACMGTNTNDLLSQAQESFRKSSDVPETKETVYIDLRNFDCEKEAKAQDISTVQRILGLNAQSESSSSSDEDEDGHSDLLWHEKRKAVKEMLKQKTEGKPLPKNVSKSRPASIKPVAARTQAQRLAGHLPPEFGMKKAKPETMTSNSDGTVISTHTDTQTEILKDDEPNLTKELGSETDQKIQTARKLREERDRERHSRIRLKSHLDAMRPTTSVGGKLPSAEATDTIFDIDASYEPSPSTLPRQLLNQAEVVLLTVRLSTNGDITTHEGNPKSIDAGGTLSASYATLLTWLLALVPQNLDFISSSGSSNNLPQPASGAPFLVIGLQQMLLDGQMCLYIAVTPVEIFTEKDVQGKRKKSKFKNDTATSTPFQKILAQFFLTNTLQDVCPWIADIVPLDVSTVHKDAASHKDSFVYTPSLPCITKRPLSTFVLVNPNPGAARQIFALPVGFFWQTITSDKMCSQHSCKGANLEYDTQVTMSLVHSQIYTDEHSTIGVLSRVLQEGLDICGVRLLYPQSHTARPVLALALRGTFARSVWLDAVGPSDPCLARRTDPHSLCALYGADGSSSCPLITPRGISAVATHLSRWFGGRVPPNGVVVAAGLHSDGQSPAATLTAVTSTDVFLVVSPLVPPSCFGLLLTMCQKRGYQLQGVKRRHLNSKQASTLGIKSEHQSLYIKSGTSTQPSDRPILDDFRSKSSRQWPQRPCTIFILRKENALRCAASLLELFMVQLSMQNLLGSIQADCVKAINTNLLFHISEFSESVLNLLGEDFSAVPRIDFGCIPGQITPKVHSNPEMEQVAVLTFTGHQLMKTFGILLGQLMNVVPHSNKSVSPQPHSAREGDFELLGLKWLTSLNRQHAKQLTPFEVGDKHWKSSITVLTSEPAVVLVLRAVNAFARLQTFVANTIGKQADSSPSRLTCLLSPNPQLAYRQVVLFFHDHELFAEPRMRVLLPYLPPVGRNVRQVMEPTSSAMKPQDRNSRSNRDAPIAESLFETLQAEPQLLCTVLVAKPEVIRRRQIGKLLSRIAHEGFVVVAMRMCVLDEHQANTILPDECTQDYTLRAKQLDNLVSGPCLVLSVQRENAIWKLLDLLGPIDPAVAKVQNCFYWHAVFGVDCTANGLYGSADYARAVEEHAMFFPDGLCCSATPELTANLISCETADSMIDMCIPARRKTVTSTNITPAEQLHNDLSSVSGLQAARAALTQTNCVLLTPPLLQVQGRTKTFAYISIIESLLAESCQLVGCRMLRFTTEQAKAFLHLSEAGSYAKVALLTSGPSIVLALQGPSVVIAFEHLLGSTYDKQSLLSKYNTNIMRATDTQQAEQLLAFMFNELTPGSRAQITLTEAT